MPICNIHLKADKPNQLPLPDENDKSLGAELKRRRLALEWTQQRCARHFGIIKDSYQKWEWNRNVPDIKKRKLVNAFLKFNFWDDQSCSLSNRVLLHRIEYSLYRMDFAKICNVSESTIERIEKNNELVSEYILSYLELLFLDRITPIANEISGQ